MNDRPPPSGPFLNCYDILATLPPAPGQPTRLVAHWTFQMHQDDVKARDWARTELAQACFQPESPAAAAILTPIRKEDLASLNIVARMFPC